VYIGFSASLLLNVEYDMLIVALQ